MNYPMCPCQPGGPPCPHWHVTSADTSTPFDDASEAIAAYEQVAAKESAELVDPSGRVVSLIVRDGT